MNYLVAASTDIGNTKQTNQDSYGIRVLNTKRGKMVFAVLCDGMGGLSKGEVASATVVDAFFKWVDRELPLLCQKGISDADIRNDWVKIVTDYNEKIKKYGRNNNISLGTTVTAILLTNERYYIINVGDTRAYEIFDYTKLITKDQTVVAREVELGKLTEDEAEIDPRRSVLLQCIGASDVVYPDLFFGSTVKDSVYMLCTDGFRHEITKDEIYQYLQPNEMTDADRMKENMDALILINKQRQERDNITVLSIRTF